VRITSSDVTLASTAASLRARHERTEVHVWTEPPPQQEAKKAEEAGKADSPAERDPVLGLAVALLERLLGHAIELFDPESLQRDEDPAPAQAQPPARQRPQIGIEIHHEVTRIEAESLAFEATGRVTTADGRTIDFQASLQMDRLEVYHESTDISIGAKRKDPLVIDLGTGPAALTGARMAFDLDGDGKTEQIATLDPTGAWLAMDRDGDGAITSGRELFGPSTGDGFAELRALDSDGDLWIDEDDRAYDQLRLWQPTTGSLQSLRDAGVGAIHLGSALTPFELGENGDSLGAMRATSAYLHEDGRAGTVRQVDLDV
jgi:hypothetical protein